MQIHLKPDFTLTVAQHELRLICLGLSRRLTNHDDMEAAEVLLQAINQQVAHALQDRLNFYSQYLATEEAQ